MAGGYPVVPSWVYADGSLPTSSLPVGLTASATINTVGSYTQLLASTAADCSWVMILLRATSTTNGLGVCGVNIAIGGSGSEVVIVPNLVVSRNASGGFSDGGSTYCFPLEIPAGTRIAANCQSNSASEPVSIAISLFSTAYCGYSGGPAIDTYGFSTAASHGAQIDPGATANVVGAYTQLTASTTYDLAGFFLGLDGTTTTPGSLNAGLDLFLATGASGAEIQILPFVQVAMTDSSAGRRALVPATTPYIPMPIPAGTRIAMQASCTSASTPSRLFSATLYGVRM